MNTDEPKKTMRHEWFEHVRKTRKKMSKGKDKQGEASQSWPKQKEKILKKKRRLEKRNKFREPLE